MDLLNRYFSRLIFQWVEEKEGYAIYAASLYNLLGGDTCRYVILFVRADLATIKSNVKITELKWQNLQTRTCSKSLYKLKSQDWIFPSNLPNVNFNVVNRNNSRTLYISDDRSFNYEVSLIHSPKKKSIYQYPNSMQLHWAIDQWNTVFTVKLHTIETTIDDNDSFLDEKLGLNSPLFELI